MPRMISTLSVDKLVAAVAAVEDPVERVANATNVIAVLRNAVALLANERAAAVGQAKADGVSYAKIGRAAGVSTSRISALGAVHNGTAPPRPSGGASRAAAKRANNGTRHAQ